MTAPVSAIEIRRTAVAAAGVVVVTVKSVDNPFCLRRFATFAMSDTDGVAADVETFVTESAALLCHARRVRAVAGPAS